MRAPLLCVLCAAGALLVPLAKAEPVREGNLQVSFDAKIAPKALPRKGAAPVSISIEGKIATTDGSPPPQLAEVKIAINGHGRLETKGLATCRLDQIQPATTAGALEACADARVGTGSFSADVVIPEQSPFPSDGEVVAFNGTAPCFALRDSRFTGFAQPRHPRTRSGGDVALMSQSTPFANSQSQSDPSWGLAKGPLTRLQGPPRRPASCTRPVIYAHVYGTEPIPTSFTLPLQVSHAKGKFATVLSASLPHVTSSVASVTGISLNLHRTYTYRGERRSYLSAGCPAPQGFPGTLYPLARASFEFTAGPRLVSTLTRSCRARG